MLGRSEAVVGNTARRLGLPKRSAQGKWGHDKLRLSGSEPTQLRRDARDKATRTITTLVVGDCAWPIGDVGDADFGFCGAPVAFGSYCARHYDRSVRHD